MNCYHRNENRIVDVLTRLDLKMDQIADAMNARIDQLFDAVKKINGENSTNAGDIKEDRSVLLPELPLKTTSSFSGFYTKLDDPSFVSQMVSD